MESDREYLEYLESLYALHDQAEIQQSSLYYVLQDRTPVPCSMEQWSCWFESNTESRRAAHNVVGRSRVSTVFLGIDHSFDSSPPIVFETMVFGGSLDGQMYRYSTWDDAVAGHQVILEEVERSQGFARWLIFLVVCVLAALQYCFYGLSRA